MDITEVAERCKNKTKEQQDVIKYFLLDRGCLTSVISDNQYAKMVAKKRDSLKLRERALQSIGLDEDEINEIPPACFEGYHFKNSYWGRRADGIWVTSKYQVAWLFFSSTQLYIYNCIFDMTADGKEEETREFFYKDVTSLSTATKIEENKEKNTTIENSVFRLVVPGASIEVDLNGVKDSSSIIQAMKQKLREKKNS